MLASILRGFGALLCAVSAPPLMAAPVADPLDRPAMMTERAAGSYLTAIARAGDRLVAVGERGRIVLSDDQGVHWRQARVPLSLTLTAVQFVGPKTGWAVGHAGVVLHTSDGGETWVRQLDGKSAAQIALDSARRSAAAQSGDAAAAKFFAQMQLMVEDGADKPFLDLYFRDKNHGWVVGAYGMAFATSDGGKSWQSAMGRLANPKALHLYAVRGSGDMLFIAGEQGLLLRSGDGGVSFAQVETPYRGSYFALALLPGGGLIVAGLRGNAYRSGDGGATFEKIDGSAPISFNAVSMLSDDRVVLLNHAGQVFASGDQGRSIQSIASPAGVPLAAIAQAADGALVAVGARGPKRLQLALQAKYKESPQ